MYIFSGQDDYDPRKHSISEDELRPQPMAKKSRKVWADQNIPGRLFNPYEVSHIYTCMYTNIHSYILLARALNMKYCTK